MEQIKDIIPQWYWDKYMVNAPEFVNYGLGLMTKA